jgi:acyl-CoA hydrolase
MGIAVLYAARAIAQIEASGRRSSVATRLKAHGTKIPSGLKGKPVNASRSEMTEVVLPQDANVLGNVLGGRVMHLLDVAAAIAAHRHSNSHVVTASVDYVDFRNPIRVGELIILKSQVNRVFHSSMEVGVKVYSENVLTGERKHTTSAYLTFVAIDEDRNPRTVPPLILRTADERRRHREALGRRRIRLAHRKTRRRFD